MAIVQISRITQRKGLQIDLPQLAGAEFGWSVDERRLFIGNGTLEEGAPVIGNTEILTQFSDILPLVKPYTYSGYGATGYSAQTGPTPSSPIEISLQNWMDQWASVKDFGAVGDGVTDDTAAINRALFQIYCREVNPSIRRSIFFPAGVYRVTDTILIPPYATLYGEGPDNSVIELDASSTADYVARTADSLQQYGVNIGNNGAQPPYSINIVNLGFGTQSVLADVFLVEDASEVNFQTTDFHGPLTTADLDNAGDDLACIRFSSTPSLVTQQITFNGCNFGSATYGFNSDAEVKSVSITDCKFDTLYQGVILGLGTVINGGPTGFSITGCGFDNIYAQGIIFGAVQLNASVQNIFYDVGNSFSGITSPTSVIFEIQNNNNVSLADMFARTDAYSTLYPRVFLYGTTSIATTNGNQIQLGQYIRESGLYALLADDQGSPATIFTNTSDAFSFEYKIARGDAVRKGLFTVTNIDGYGLDYTDDYTEMASTGIILSATQSGGTVSIQYTSTFLNIDADFRYSISRVSYS